MNGFRKACILHVVGCGILGVFAACGDDTTIGPDAGLPKSDATVGDGSLASDGGSSSGHLIMTYSAQHGEIVDYDTLLKQVAGRATTPGFAVVQRSMNDTFLLETGQDLVARLDPSNGFSIASSWNVALSDAFDGGESYADPVQVVESAANKAYVIRYNRGHVAIIDPSQTADAGAAIGSVDLSSLLQPNDLDGHIDMAGAAYDASRHRLYVALGNIDIYNVDPKGYFLLCANTVSTLVAIDTTTDTLVNLGGTGPGGGIALNGYGPQSGYLGGVVLDAVGDRLLVFSAGCNAPTTDGGQGPLQGRLVEAVDLKTNTTKTLLDANTQDYPGQLVYMDGAHAIIQFGYGAFGSTYAWDPTQTTLGTPLAATPDVFDLDYANARILGPQSTFASDGGAGPTNVIAVSLADGGVTQFGQNPFLQSGGFIGNALYAP